LKSEEAIWRSIIKKKRELESNIVVQMKATLTISKIDSKNELQPETVLLMCNDTNDGNAVKSYLIYVKECFLKSCKDKYIEERAFMKDLEFCGEGLLLDRYCSADLSRTLDLYLGQNNDKKTKSYRKVYPESSFDPAKKRYELAMIGAENR